MCAHVFDVGRYWWHPDEDIWFEIYVVIRLSAVMIYLDIMCTLCQKEIEYFPNFKKYTMFNN